MSLGEGGSFREGLAEEIYSVLQIHAEIEFEWIRKVCSSQFTGSHSISFGYMGSVLVTAICGGQREL